MPVIYSPGGFHREQDIVVGISCSAIIRSRSQAARCPDRGVFTKQVWHDGHPVKPGDIMGRLVLFKIGLRGSEMVLARDFEGFGLFGANVLFGAFNAGMAEQELGRAQVAGLLIDVSWEGPAQ